MSIILPPSGTNVQRWFAIKIVPYPALDRFMVARDDSNFKNVRWNIIFDYEKLIRQTDGGSWGWTEVYKGWSLNLVEAQSSTITAINADTRAGTLLVPNVALQDTLNAAQRTAIANFLQNNVGFTLSEVSTFNLVGKTVRQILSFLNAGKCSYRWDELTQMIVEDYTINRGVGKTLDGIIDEFNREKS